MRPRSKLSGPAVLFEDQITVSCQPAATLGAVPAVFEQLAGHHGWPRAHDTATGTALLQRLGVRTEKGVGGCLGEDGCL